MLVVVEDSGAPGSNDQGETSDPGTLDLTDQEKTEDSGVPGSDQSKFDDPGASGLDYQGKTDTSSAPGPNDQGKTDDLGVPGPDDETETTDPVSKQQASSGLLNQPSQGGQAPPSVHSTIPHIEGDLMTLCNDFSKFSITRNAQHRNTLGGEDQPTSEPQTRFDLQTELSEFKIPELKEIIGFYKEMEQQLGQDSNGKILQALRKYLSEGVAVNDKCNDSLASQIDMGKESPQQAPRSVKTLDPATSIPKSENQQVDADMGTLEKKYKDSHPDLDKLQLELKLQQFDNRELLLDQKRLHLLLEIAKFQEIGILELWSEEKEEYQQHKAEAEYLRDALAASQTKNAELESQLHDKARELQQASDKLYQNNEKLTKVEKERKTSGNALHRRGLQAEIMRNQINNLEADKQRLERAAAARNKYHRDGR
ncbi:hypothetical protein TWF730_005064 [Orbilia blumenaviensis]|uniref:Uncharacterized protein n=1 Tax=Orbilia blumenaviensis TaxID=1796055 RepID=A0AAV9VJM0_9PEZI